MPSKPQVSRSSPVSSDASAAVGTPSMSVYAFMTERGRPSRSTISNGASSTSASSRGPTDTGARLRPAFDAE